MKNGERMKEDKEERRMKKKKGFLERAGVLLHDFPGTAFHLNLTPLLIISNCVPVFKNVTMSSTVAESGKFYPATFSLYCQLTT